MNVKKRLNALQDDIKLQLDLRNQLDGKVNSDDETVSSHRQDVVSLGSQDSPQPLAKIPVLKLRKFTAATELDSETA